MAVADTSAVSYAVESSLKTLDPAARMTLFPIQQATPDTRRGFSPSGEARDDRYDTEEDLVSHDAGLTIRRKFRPYLYDPFLQSALWGAWTRLAHRENVAGAAAKITDVDAAGQTYAVSDETVDFAPLMLVRASGFANAENNGLKVATVGTDATSLVVAGGGLVDETPGAGAMLEMVGFAFPAGDLSISGDTIVSAAGTDFAAFGLRQGMWLKIGGKEAANRFAASAVNDAVRIGSVGPAGTITVDWKPAGWTDDAGAGKTVYLFVAEYMTPGVVQTTMTWQMKVKRKADTFLQRILGAHVSRLTLDGQARGDYVMNVELRGLDFLERNEDGTPLADLNALNGGAIRLAQQPAMVAGLSGQRLYLDGVYATKGVAVQSSSLVIEPTLVPIDVEGCFGYEDMDPSTQMARFTGRAHFQTGEIYDRYADQSKVGFARIMQAGAGAYVFESSRLQFTESPYSLDGPGSSVTVNFASKATADDVAIERGDLNGFFAAHRFRWAEGWPNLC